MNKEKLIKFEKEIAELFNQAKIRAPVHLYHGNEDQIIKVFKKIKKEDWVFCSWRSHYQCLLKGVPEKEIKEFAESVLPGVDNYFVGHFHVDREIKVDGCSSVLRVVPDWLSQRKLIRVSAEGTKEVLHFQNGSFENAH